MNTMKMATKLISNEAIGLVVLLMLTLCTSWAHGCPSHCRCETGSAYCSTLKAIPTYFPDDIKVIHVFDSNFDTFPSRSFQTLPKNLTDLLIYNIKVKSIKTCAFENVKYLNKFSMSDVDIGTIEPGAFGGVQHVHTFTMTSFIVRKVSHHAFKDMKHIVNFDISRGNWSTIETHAFAGLHNVSKITLYRLSSDSIHSAPFEGMSMVNTFNFYLSNLPEIPAFLFPTAPTHVSFHLNNIKTLTCSALDNWKQSNFVSANKVPCNCALHWIFELDPGYPRILLDGFDCISPPGTKGRKLSSFMNAPGDLPCSDPHKRRAFCGEIIVIAADAPYEHCSASFRTIGAVILITLFKVIVDLFL